MSKKVMKLQFRHSPCCPSGQHRVPVRRPHRLPGHGRQGEALPGPDLQHAAQGIFIQRDSQQEGGAGDNVRAVHTCAGERIST